MDSESDRLIYDACQIAEIQNDEIENNENSHVSFYICVYQSK